MPNSSETNSSEPVTGHRWPGGSHLRPARGAARAQPPALAGLQQPRLSVRSWRFTRPAAPAARDLIPASGSVPEAGAAFCSARLRPGKLLAWVRGCPVAPHLQPTPCPKAPSPPTRCCHSLSPCVPQEPTLAPAATAPSHPPAPGGSHSKEKPNHQDTLLPCLFGVKAPVICFAEPKSCDCSMGQGHSAKTSRDSCSLATDGRPCTARRMGSSIGTVSCPGCGREAARG